jgi:Sulfotransferase domain
MLSSASGTPPIKRAAHSVTVAAGHLTHSARMLPSFLIVGAQRCGTTSMYRALSQHPAVLKAVLHKGVHYFDTDYQRGIGWYQGHFPLKAHARWVGRSAGTAPVTFEATPYYMFHPLVAQRISGDLPGVKLLVQVRDPVERAYSAHAHELARGYETEPFERALELEASRLDGEVERLEADPRYLSHSHQHQAYRTRGQYVEQLERLERYFGRDRIHVMDSDAFFTDPEPNFAAVLDFLGLPHCGDIDFERYNARARAPMPDALRAQLREHFRPYDERLARWLGGKPSWQT